MPEVIMLGTGRALPTATQENTYLALSGAQSLIMVDCAGAPYRQMLKAGLDPARLSALIITHFHPDHAYGVPSLLISLWLAGRTQPLDLYAPDAALSRVRDTLDLYDPDSWPGMYTVNYHGIATTRGAPVLTDDDFTITAARGLHFIPTVGLRITDRATGLSLAYSSDTEPSADIAELARGADLLIHEASGSGRGHSSAAQAAGVAGDARARRLVLVHYDRTATPPATMRRQARSVFSGEITVAKDFDRFTW